MMTPSTPQFKYVTVRDSLRDRIGSMPTGTLLPSEGQLCAEYQVSRITLRKAVDYLVEEGLLTKEQGRGTYTSTPSYALKYRETFVDSIAGFYTDMSSRGHEVGTQVLEQRREPASATVAQELGLVPGTMVVAIRRLRSVDGTVNHLVHTFLPGDRFSAVTDVDLEHQSLYEYLREQYGVVLARSRFVVEVDEANRQQADLLNLDLGAPLLVVSSTVMDERDQPLLCGTSWLLPQSSQVEFEVIAGSGPVAKRGGSA